MYDILRKITLAGIVPVIKINDAEKAVPVARALCKGGIPTAEVTFRTAQAQEAISRITRELPDMLVGAGTVLNTEQADRAAEAGAMFIVTPGLNPKVVEHCIKIGVPVIPGCSTPSDIEQAIELGLDTVKFFPAEAAGGVKMLKALSGPYGNISFMPTGGIDAGNINEYLSFSKVLACGGSWMVPENLMAEGNFERITKLAREAMERMLGFKFDHVAINIGDKEQINKAASEFSDMLGFSNNGCGSIWADGSVELVKEQYQNCAGYIAIRTNYIDRAVSYLTGKGYKFDQYSAKYDSYNKLKSIYLENKLGGFAVLLIQ